MLAFSSVNMLVKYNACLRDIKVEDLSGMRVNMAIMTGCIIQREFDDELCPFLL